MRNSKKFIVLAFVLIMTFTLTACGGGGETPADGSELEGAVIVDGSGTVYPLMAHIAEEYMTNEESGVSVQVGRAGSSAGFKKFIPGETDFSDSSRKIKDEEITQLEENGLMFGEDVMEIKLAYDGLTMVINSSNDWATEMTDEEIVNMYLSGTYSDDDVVLWSDIRPEWPAEEVNFYGPNENHGTFEFFYESILDEQDMVKTANLQQEYSTLVDLVANDEYAIAFFGYGYYASNTDKLQAVNIDFGKGPVGPALETIGEDLPYAGFTRLVYTYLNLDHAEAKPQVLDFAMYVVSPEGAARLAGENGFAPLPSEVYSEYYQQLEALK
ncbi:PstS family phosphate ABC transporter substrate-binding protein [Gudongella sp. DL1XJH-153]|uniref:PstS family phosphate ABC transporter substrate-binding protein n=1 Tax=Gudongella sp. DL1XJH-153 TaxID=3409804 RepID=UPI003BB6F171